VVFGGTHATFDPEIAMDPSVDACVVGEAEGAMVELAEALSRRADWRHIQNLAFDADGTLHKNELRPLISDLDTLPIPDRDLYYRYRFISKFPWKKFTTGRGCVHSCSFCWNTTLADMYKGKGVFTRRKSPARAVDEVVHVLEAHPTKTIHFSDDLFTVYPKWLEEFAEEYRARVPIPFTCNTSIELVNSRTMGALARAGARGVGIGIETGNEDLRSKILNKTVTNQDIREAAKTIKGQGLELITYNMIASPGETIDDAFATLNLNREIQADHVRCNLAIPLPHTAWELSNLETGGLAADYGENRVASMEHPEVAFSSEEQQAFVNLFYMFRPAVHYPALDPLVRRLVHQPFPRLLDFLRLWIPLEEKRICNLSWLDGLRYFSHVGDPHKRTANYPTLI
jgi:radical SAM superfamily enzyme YgiQ (UPF0313 family)